MSIAQNNLADQLRVNVQKIKLLLENSQGKNQDLLIENEKLNNKIRRQELEFQELNNKYESLKLAKAMITSSDESHDAKIKLNQIVREIDKCISLLNR